MKFILIAEDEDKTKFFFPTWEIIIFVVVVSFIFYLLFPQDLLNKSLSYHEPSPAILNYLQAWERVYPQNPDLTVSVLEQEANLGLIKEAQTKLATLKKQQTDAQMQSQLQWIDYLILRHQAYQAKPNTKERIAYLQQLRQSTSTLAQLPLKDEQLKTLALDSQIVAQAPVTLQIYNRLMAMDALKTPEELAMGGSIAMQNNAHQNSADFYEAAYKLAENDIEKRKYAMKVVEVLWAGNRLNEALVFAEQLPEAVTNDRNFLLYLSHLAIAANQPKIAEKYALKALLTK